MTVLLQAFRCGQLYNTPPCLYSLHSLRGEASHKLSKNAGHTTNKRHETLTNQLSTRFRANMVYSRLTKVQDADDELSSDDSDIGEASHVGQPEVGYMKLAMPVLV